METRKIITVFLIVIGVAIWVPAFGQVTNNLWKVAPGATSTIAPVNSSYKIQIPILANGNSDCLYADASGTFKLAANPCGTGGGGGSTTINGFTGSVFTIQPGSGITSTVSNGSTTFTLNLSSGCSGSQFVATISPTGTISCATPSGGASSTNVYGTNGVSVVQVGVNATASLDTTYAPTLTGLWTFNKGAVFSATTTFNSSTLLTFVTSTWIGTNASGAIIAEVTPLTTSTGNWLGTWQLKNPSDFLSSSTVLVSSVNGSSGAVTITSSSLGVIWPTVNGSTSVNYIITSDGTTINATRNGATTTFSLINTGNWAGTWQGVNSTTFYLASNPNGYISSAPATSTITASGTTATGPSFTFGTSTTITPYVSGTVVYWLVPANTFYPYSGNPSNFLTTAVTSINGDTTAAQKITVSGGMLTSSTAAGVTTIGFSTSTLNTNISALGYVTSTGLASYNITSGNPFLTISTTTNSATITATSAYVGSVNGATGTITNVAKTNADNAFSTGQTVSGNVTSTGVTNSGVTSSLVLATSTGQEIAYGGSSTSGGGNCLTGVTLSATGTLSNTNGTCSGGGGGGSGTVATTTPYGSGYIPVVSSTPADLTNSALYENSSTSDLTENSTSDNGLFSVVNASNTISLEVGTSTSPSYNLVIQNGAVANGTNATSATIFTISSSSYIDDWFGGTPLSYTGGIFNMTAVDTISNTNASTSMITTGVGTTTIPANTLQAGSAIVIQANGTWHTAAASPGTFQPWVEIGSNYVSGNSIAPTVSVNNAGWGEECRITIQSAGTNGVYAAGCRFTGYTTAITGQNLYYVVDTSTINTTIPNAVNIGWKMQTATSTNAINTYVLNISATP